MMQQRHSGFQNLDGTASSACKTRGIGKETTLAAYSMRFYGS